MTSTMTSTMTKNEMFGYEETDSGMLKFFNEIAQWQLEDWFTKPIDGCEDWTDAQKIDFIKNKLEDAYEAETTYRYEETDQDCLYDIDHLIWLSIKDTPENREKISYHDDFIHDSFIYASHTSDEEDWDFLDGEILIQLLNEWDWLILTREYFSERIIDNFCGYFGIDESDIINKTLSING